MKRQSNRILSERVLACLRQPWVKILAGLSGLICLVYDGVLFGGKTFVLRDAIRFTMPSREFLGKSFASGRIPEWYDGVGFGVAFASNPVHLVVSPLGWLLGLFDSTAAVDAHTLLHLLIAAAGTAAFASRLGADCRGSLFAGSVLGTSGYVTSVLANGNLPCVAWTPWVAWAAHRFAVSTGTAEPAPARARQIRSSLLLATMFALQLSSGEPGATLTAGLLTLALVLIAAQRRLAAIVALVPTLVFAAALAAVSLLPALLLLPNSARGAGLTSGGLQWSLHPWRALEWIWPLPFGSEGNESWFVGAAIGLPPGDPCWSFSLFVGAPVILLAFSSLGERLNRRLLLTSFGFVLLAFGSYTPIYGALLTILPPLRVVNFPEKFFYGALLLWCGVAGAAFPRLLESHSRRLRYAAGALATAILLGAVAAVTAIEAPRIMPWVAHRARLQGLLLNLSPGIALSAESAWIAAGGAATFSAALWIATRKSSLRRMAAPLALLGALAPLVYTARVITPLAPRSLLEQTPTVLASLPSPPLGQAGVRPRLFLYPAEHERAPCKNGAEIALAIHESLDTNVAARFGYDVIPGFETGDSAAFRRFWEQVSPRMSSLAFDRLLGVDFALVPDPESYAPGAPVLARLPGWGLMSAWPVRPRAFVAPRSSVVSTPEEGLESLAWPGREQDPARVVLSGAGAAQTETRGPLVPCRITTSCPEEVRLDCDAPFAGHAVLLDEAFPGWTATLDGRDVPILVADGLFRAVEVGPGPHEVVFRYRTPGLRLGAAVSLLAILVALLACRWQLDRNRARE